MKVLVATLIIGLLATPATLAADKRNETACAEVKEKIRNIEARMRSGYTRAQGERYNEKLRELKAKRAKLWADEEWLAYTRKSAELGALESQNNRLMNPVSFCPLVAKS